MNVREQKGRQIAARGGLEERGSYWLVPSQAGAGTYVVDVEGEPPTCTCPDYELSGLKCKHIYAVEYALHLTCSDAPHCPSAAPTAPKKPTYRQDWPAYNAAQTQEKALFQDLLFTLCQSIDEPVQTMGRPRHSLRDLVFAAAFKVYATVSARRFASDLADAYSKGYLARLPHHSSVFRIFEDTDLTPILHALIERSSRPLHVVETRFAVDSSGFTTCQYVRWYDAKYGRETDRRDWRKVHLMCGVTTNIVTSVRVTDKDGAEYPQFRPLLQTTARDFRIDEVSADKAYSGRSNLSLVAKHGGSAYIPFTANARGRMSSDDLWDTLYHFYHVHRESFLEHYHKRSLSESTFSMLKAKFGAAIRSKTDVAQVNELLCKVLCHNLCVLIQSMFELGIKPRFSEDAS